jgi:hypothetical protein
VFFGTPHQGGNGASFADVFVNIGLFLTRNPSNNYLKTLKRNSESARGIADDFRSAAKSIQILSFYETVPVRHLRVRNVAFLKGIVSPLSCDFLSKVVSSDMGCRLSIKDLQH